jgi:hypothetical protein
MTAEITLIEEPRALTGVPKYWPSRSAVMPRWPFTMARMLWLRAAPGVAQTGMILYRAA